MEFLASGDWHLDDQGNVCVTEGDGVGTCHNHYARVLCQREWRHDISNFQWMQADLSRDDLIQKPGARKLIVWVIDSFIADREIEQKLEKVDDGKNPEDPLDSNVFDHESHEEWASRGTDGGH